MTDTAEEVLRLREELARLRTTNADMQAATRRMVTVHAAELEVEKVKRVALEDRVAELQEDLADALVKLQATRRAKLMLADKLVAATGVNEGDDRPGPSRPASSSSSSSSASSSSSGAGSGVAPRPMRRLPWFRNFPRSSFFDDWKRVFTNAPDRVAAMDWFWARFESDKYSVWEFEYKAPEENRVAFITSNRLTGFVQECGHCVSALFGALLALENRDGGRPEPGYPIVGCLVIKGLEIQPLLDDDTTMTDGYTWKQMAADNVNDRARIGSFWTSAPSDRFGADHAVLDVKVLK